MATDWLTIILASSVVSAVVTVAFIAKCGYRWQQDASLRIEQAVGMLLYPDNLLIQFEQWLPRLGLEGQSDMGFVGTALEHAVETLPDDKAPGVRAQLVLDAVGTRAGTAAQVDPARAA